MPLSPPKRKRIISSSSSSSSSTRRSQRPKKKSRTPSINRNLQARAAAAPRISSAEERQKLIERDALLAKFVQDSLDPQRRRLLRSTSAATTITRPHTAGRTDSTPAAKTCNRHIPTPRRTTAAYPSTPTPAPAAAAPQQQQHHSQPPLRIAAVWS